jgi:hypothetical protein
LSDKPEHGAVTVFQLPKFTPGSSEVKKKEAPTDSPHRTTLSGSPPKPAMFVYTVAAVAAVVVVEVEVAVEVEVEVEVVVVVVVVL